MAIFAVTLLAGSALADTIGDSVGNIAFHGTARQILNDDGDIYAFTVLEDNEFYPGKGIFSFLKSMPTGIFDGYIPDLAWNPLTGLKGFPAIDNMSFKDELSLAVLDNVFLWSFYSCDGVPLGSIEGFSFCSSKLSNYYENFTVEGQGLISFTLSGSVIFEGKEYDATYTVQFENNNYNARPDIWLWDIDVDVYERETPPEAPEPGTLVLLGTGIMGAAIVARKKIKK